MDGPFVSLDPILNRDCHVLYDVEHSIHTHAVGRIPKSRIT